jgi:cobalamin-dependent methionine synthase I
LLAESRYAAVFALTVGDRIDAAMVKLAPQDFTEAYFLDGVASAMTDGLLQLLKHDLRAEAARRGCALGYRFSPGYARWDLQEQEKIFKLLRGEEIGISLSETYFMLPQKSLSGVFGFKPIASHNETGSSVQSAQSGCIDSVSGLS